MYFLRFAKAATIDILEIENKEFKYNSKIDNFRSEKTLIVNLYIHKHLHACTIISSNYILIKLDLVEHISHINIEPKSCSILF